MQNEYDNWIEDLKANKEHTLEMLYTDNYPKIERYVLANNGNMDQAKDLFQEAFIICWRAIQEDKFYPENESSTAGYLYKIAKFKWLDYLRSGHYRKLVSMPDDMEQPEWEEETEYEVENRRLINAAFLKLGDSCKNLLTRFYFKKESMKIIAAAFGWTDATARNNKYRCIQQLKSIIHKQ